MTVEKIKAAIKAAYEEGQGKLKGNGKTVPPLKAIKTPLRDGDEERPDDEAYAGCYFINANSATKPGVVDASCQPILDTSELYSGIYGRASINFYAFNTNGNKGIACGLNNLQNSKAGWYGLAKKGSILMLIIVAVRLDILLNTNYVRDAVCIAFCVNELLSIVENTSLMGIPYPPALKNAIEVLQKQTGRKDDKDD